MPTRADRSLGFFLSLVSFSRAHARLADKLATDTASPSTSKKHGQIGYQE